MPKDIRILLVEDNPGDARLIREMLVGTTRERMLIDPVTTLADALERVQHNTYDAVLLDLSLPDSHGMDTLLDMESEASDIAIVVLTGVNDDSLGVQAVQMGAQDYLSKSGVDSHLLVRSIRYAVERQRTEKALRRSAEEYRSLIDDVFDTSMVAVLILDRDFYVVWCNEATEAYFGIERENLLGRDKRQLIDSELKCIFADPDDYSTRLLQAYKDSIFTGRFECEVLAEGDRQARWLEHWSQPIRDGIYVNGRIEQYTDITDRKRLEIAEREQSDFAGALHDISALLTSSLDLSEVLTRILANLGRVVHHDSALITLMEDAHFRIAQHARNAKGDTQEVIAKKRLQLDYKLFANTMYETGQPVIIADLQQHPQVDTAAASAQIHAYMGVPIQLKDSVIGFINLLSEQPDYFQDKDAQRLSAFAKLAAIAIQNARLFDQSRDLAAHQERVRLARDLHDSISQTLFTCRTMSETALRRWDKDPAGAFQLIHDVNHLITTGLSEMRILLMELHPAALTEISLKQLFEQYLQPIQDRRQFELILTINDIPPLPPHVQIALYRITQEALNNIDKHAQASQVEVRAAGDADHVTVYIRDNGRGFEPDAAAGSSMGLVIMRERADEIGAALEIISKIDVGTQIKVIWRREQTL